MTALCCCGKADFAQDTEDHQSAYMGADMDYIEQVKARMRRQQAADDAEAIRQKTLARTRAKANGKADKIAGKVDAKPAKEPKEKRGQFRCNRCGFPIRFKVLPNGKKCPTNPDGSDHWDDCKKAIRGSRPFDPARDMKLMAETIGENYRPTQSTALPWEDE